MPEFRPSPLQFWSGVFLACLVPAACLAAELPDLPPELGGETVPQVLTPARLAQAQVDAAASVTVIDRDMIAALGVRDVPDLLRLVPGMMVTNESEAGHTFAVNYHGTNLTDIRRLQVLVDGMSVIQPGLARILWSDLALAIEDIERIEVTRGPNAAAYGSNSFSGVVNIITTHPQDSSDNLLRVAGGKRDIADGTLRLVGHGDNGDTRLTLTAKSDSGFDFVRRGGEARDDRRVEAVNWRSEYRPNGSDRIEVLLGLADTRKEMEADDFGILNRYEELPVSDTENISLLGRWSRALSPAHEIQVQAYTQRTESRNPFRGCLHPILLSDELAALAALDPDYATGLLDAADPFAFIATLPPAAQALAGDVLVRYGDFLGSGFNETCGDVDFDIRESRFDIEVQDTLRISDQLRLVSGASYRRDSASSASYTGGQVDNEILRLFAHGEYRLVDPLLLNLGAMLEDDDISGSSLSPRAGINWRIRDQQALRLVGSRAFRTQDLYEEHANTRITFGNLSPPYSTDGGVTTESERDLFLMQQAPGNLKPEEINSLELGYFGYFPAARLEVDVRWFRERLGKLISDPINPFDFETDNSSRTELNGIEWQAKHRVAPGSWLWASYAYIDNESTHPNELKFTARHSGSFAVAHRFPSRWSGSAAWYVERHQNENKVRDRRFHLDRLDLRLARDIPLGEATLQFFANAQYDFDDRPHIHLDNNYDSRIQGYLGMQITF
ncbi:MAG: TonB-dependent receptor plug domain-containing protein [Pseudomonadota bacterium]